MRHRALPLTLGQAGDVPAGRELMRNLKELPKRRRLIMDSAYEDNETQRLALDLELIPLVPSHPLRVETVDRQECLVSAPQ